MSLPLNIPFLLKILRPNAKYVCRGRSYDDLDWLDSEPKPTLKEFQMLFLQIQGKEAEQKSYAEKIKAKFSESAHEAVQEATKHVANILAEIDDATSNEIARVRALAEEEKDARVKRAAALVAEIKAEILAAGNKEIAELEEGLAKIRAELANHQIQILDDTFLELDGCNQAEYDAAIKYIAETDWYLTRKDDPTCGKEIPDQILKNRAAAREIARKSRLVYKEWAMLRAKEYPVKEEQIRAMKSGRDELAKLIHEMKAVDAKYPRPKKKEDWR